MSINEIAVGDGGVPKFRNAPEFRKRDLTGRHTRISRTGSSGRSLDDIDAV